MEVNDIKTKLFSIGSGESACTSLQQQIDDFLYDKQLIDIKIACSKYRLLIAVIYTDDQNKILNNANTGRKIYNIDLSIE